MVEDDSDRLRPRRTTPSIAFHFTRTLNSWKPDPQQSAYLQTRSSLGPCSPFTSIRVVAKPDTCIITHSKTLANVHKTSANDSRVSFSQRQPRYAQDLSAKHRGQEYRRSETGCGHSESVDNERRQPRFVPTTFLKASPHEPKRTCLHPTTLHMNQIFRLEPHLGVHRDVLLVLRF